MLGFSQLRVIPSPEQATGRDSICFLHRALTPRPGTCRAGMGHAASPAPSPYSTVGVSSSAILREAGISHWNPGSLLQPAFGAGQRRPHQPRDGGGVSPHPFHAHPDPASAAPLADPPPPPAAGRAGKRPPRPSLGYLLGLSLTPPAPLSLPPSRPAADTRGHAVTRTCSHLHIHTGPIRGRGEEGPGCAPLGGTRHSPLAAGLYQVRSGSAPSRRHAWYALTSPFLGVAAPQASSEGVTRHSHDPAVAFRSNRGFLLS